MKNQKGITLVALIITIIVMLILAGVSISLVVGDNGVLTQAQKAGNATERGTMMDAVSLGNAGFNTEYYMQTTDAAKKAFNVPSKLAAEILKNYKSGNETGVTVTIAAVNGDDAVTDDTDIMNLFTTDNPSTDAVETTVTEVNAKVTFTGSGIVTEDNNNVIEGKLKVVGTNRILSFTAN